ncbi:hypothetical protein [Comamonas sp. C24C]
MNRSIACLDSSKKNHGQAALTLGAATKGFDSDGAGFIQPFSPHAAALSRGGSVVIGC